MNVWLLFAILLVLGLVPCAVACMRGEPLLRLVGLETANTIFVLVLMLLAKGLDREFLFDLALAQALLSFGGTLAFIRFFERWL